jgi:glutamyl-tRNA synthetase
VTPGTDRLRFAPSPTGYLHVGGARTVLFNWLHARNRGGEMLLRIEDTDTERNRPELAQNILDMIEWLGLGWDGDPVLQSERSDQYAAAAKTLFDSGRAYACDCTAEQVQARAKERGGTPGYDGFCRDRGLVPGRGLALRFRTPDVGATEFDDVIRGHVSFENANLEDFVLLRSNETPTFLLANVVDDADMGITHVIRGEEHLNGTPKYLLIGEALGLGYRPVFAHLPVLVNEQRKKLSKRKDSVSVAEFKDAGYLPEAMVNYLALLGWGPKDGVEIRPLQEIVEQFRLEDVTPSPAFFDIKKLQHVNAEYIRALSPDELIQRALPFFQHGAETAEVLRPLAAEVRDRVRLLTEVEPMIDFLREAPLEVDADSWAKATKDPVQAMAVLDAAIASFEQSDWTPGDLHERLEAAGAALGLKLNKAQAPVRVAVTGRSVGPPLFESLAVLGRERSLDRLRAARNQL